MNGAEVEQQCIEGQGVGLAHRAGGLQGLAVCVQVGVQFLAAVQHLPTHRAVVTLKQQCHLMGICSILKPEEK